MKRQSEHESVSEAPLTASDRGAVIPAKSSSSLVDDAYLQYCELRESGEPINLDEFCEQFPAVQSSLAHLLQAHRFLEAIPDLQEVRWPEIGESILDFRLIQLLGIGAFARVYLARETKLGERLVAVKIAWMRGTAEAEILGPLHHPNIVPVYSIQRDAATGLTAVCMPYLGSATLHDVLDRLMAEGAPPSHARYFLEAANRLACPLESMPPDAPAQTLCAGTYTEGVSWVGVQLAKALAYIHGRGICHLDLKPSNVLLGPNAVPMLLDFNLATKRLEGHQGLGGTIPYMSPEQLQVLAKQGRANVDAASDVFSLGVLLYQLATGRHPFGPIPLNASSEELVVHMRQRQATGCAPIRSINPAIGKELALLIERCLALDSATRPKSADLALRLQNLLVPATPKRQPVRRRVMVLVAMLVLIAAAGAGIAAFAISPSAIERHQAAGHKYFQEKKYTEAVQSFSDAIAADEIRADLYFARGRAHQKLGGADKVHWSLAVVDFQRAEALAPDARNHAAIAFCTQNAEQDGAAVLAYKRALNGGFENAIVHSNLAYSLRRTGAKPADVRSHLDRATKLDPTLQAAYHLRAMVHLYVAKNHISLLETIAQRPEAAATIPEMKQNEIRAELADALRLGMADMQEAIRLGPQSSELSFNAACFYATASAVDSEWKTESLQHLTKAVTQGLDPKKLNRELLLAPVAEERQFKVLSDLPSPDRPPPPLIRVFDPILD